MSNRYRRTERQIDTMFGCAVLLTFVLSALVVLAALAGVVWLWGAVL